MTPGVTTTEAELAAAARAGDLDAFSRLYETYFEPIYDYLVRLTRSRELAADLAQDTFVRAMQKLPQLEEPAAFRGWLYQIARSQALNRLDREKRSIPLAPVEEESEGLNPLLRQVDEDRVASPALAAEIEESAALVWEAAAGLDERTYTVLDLTVRHGLDSGEIARVMGVSTGNAYTMVSRMKDRVETVIGSYVMSRKADHGCAELHAILVGVEFPPMTPELARSVGRHVDGCDTCDSERRRLLTPANVFAAFAAVASPHGLAADVWRDIESRWADEGPRHPHRVARRIAWLAGLLVVTGLIGVLRAEPVADPLTAGSTDVLSVTIDQTEPTDATSTTSTLPADDTTTSTAAVTTTPPSTVAPPTTTTATTEPPTTPPTAPPTTTTATTAPPTTTTPSTQPPVNQPPRTSILDPANGSTSCEGSRVVFAGEATDPEGESLSLESLVWSSSIDGELGRGSSVVRTPSVGAHTITFTAEDSAGAQGSTSISIEVIGRRTGACAVAPTVTIVSPADGAFIRTTASVATVRGVATVTDDFDTGLTVTWTSSLDGVVGVGNVASLTLTAGCPAMSHVLTASATDSDGATGSASVTIQVGC